MAVVGHEDTSKTTLYVSPIHLLVPYPCLATPLALCGKVRGRVLLSFLGIPQ